MRILLYIVCGLAGGVLGGMGLGGGTLLIPLLRMVMKVSPDLAAEINLIAFIPMSVVAIFVHRKNGLIEKKKAVFLIAFALIGSLAAAFLVKRLSSIFLEKSFGWFLILIGSFSLLFGLLGKNEKGE